METIKEKMQKDSQEYGSSQSAQLFQFKEAGKGDYKFRVLTDPVCLATHFFGKGQPSHICYGAKNGCPYHKPDEKSASRKYIMYIVDRKDGEVKLAEFPLSIIMSIADFQDDEDYSFDSYPMPYDVKVKYNPDEEDPKSIYKTLGAPQKEPVTTQEQEKLTDKMGKLTPEQYVEKRKTVELNKSKEAGTWISPEKIAENQKVRLDELNANGPKDKTDEKVIEYPTEDINPEDIPF